MPATHRTLEGTVLSLKGLTPAQRDFLRHLDRLRRRGTHYFELLRTATAPYAVAYGLGGKFNPRYMSSPLYLAARDIATRAGVEQDVLLHPREEKELEQTRRELGPVLSVAQAAELIGISRAAVYKAISKGTLKSKQIGKLTLVVLSSAKAYRKARAA